MDVIGKRVIVRPIDYSKKKPDRKHIYYGKKGTVIGVDTLDRYIVAMDDFPDCNCRVQMNRFWYDAKEVKFI